jgi:hypothetical protein
MGMTRFALAALTLLQCIHAFVPIVPQRQAVSAKSRLFSTTQEGKETEETTNGEVHMNTRIEAITATNENAVIAPDPEAGGLPWWWELVWGLDVMRLGYVG